MTAKQISSGPGLRHPTFDRKSMASKADPVGGAFVAKSPLKTHAQTRDDARRRSRRTGDRGHSLVVLDFGVLSCACV